MSAREPSDARLRCLTYLPDEHRTNGYARNLRDGDREEGQMESLMEEHFQALPRVGTAESARSIGTSSR
jgi:hypothetical protein